MDEKPKENEPTDAPLVATVAPPAVVSRKPAETPAEAALARASQAIADAIAAMVAGTDRGKFHKIGRLASIGAEIGRERSRRVADFAQVGPYGAAVLPVLPGLNRDADDVDDPDLGLGRAPAPVNDQTRLVRELMLTANKQIENVGKPDAGRVALNEIDEIHQLRLLVRMTPKAERAARKILSCLARGMAS